MPKRVWKEESKMQKKSINGKNLYGELPFFVYQRGSREIYFACPDGY